MGKVSAPQRVGVQGKRAPWFWCNPNSLSRSRQWGARAPGASGPLGLGLYYGAVTGGRGPGQPSTSSGAWWPLLPSGPAAPSSLH